MFTKGTLKFLNWFDKRVRRHKNKSDFSLFIYDISNRLSEKFLKNLEKKFQKNRIWCKNFFNLYEEKIWLLAQHLDNNPQLQSTYLTLFRLFVNDNSHIAYLEDSVLCVYHGKQKYGTQILEGPNYNHYLYPIIGICEYGEMSQEEIKALNQRRQKMELISIQDYAKDLLDYSGIYLNLQILKKDF
jgi:hypothetical protein